MRVLVTGGAGFVGTNLIKRLLKDGHEVISVDNYSTGKKRMNNLVVTITTKTYLNGLGGCLMWKMKLNVLILYFT